MSTGKRKPVVIVVVFIVIVVLVVLVVLVIVIVFAVVFFLWRSTDLATQIFVNKV